MCNKVCQAVGVEEDKLPSDGVITILKSVNIDGTDYDVTRIAGGQDDKLSGNKGDEFGAFGGSSEAPCDKVKGVKFADGSEVTKIGDHAFRFCTNLLSIENLPATLTEIGGYCFESSQLKDIDLSKTGLTSLPDGCFYNCSKLESIVMPSGTLTYLGEKAFYGNSSLKSIDLTNSSFDILRNATFEGCSSLSNVVLPLSLKSIWGKALLNCKSLTEIILPSNIDGIWENSFQGSGLKSITFPLSVKHIGHHAFAETPISNVVFPAFLEEIADYAFENCNNITSFVVPKYVSSLGMGICHNCKGLVSATINSNQVGLAFLAFRDCDNLKDLYITSDKMLGMGKDTYSITNGVSIHVLPSLISEFEAGLATAKVENCTVNSDFPITLGSDYATFSSAFNLDFSTADGLTAYKGGVDADKSTVNLTQVSKVTASKGIVLKGEAGKTYTAKILDADATGDSFDDNKIQASVDGTYLTQSTDYVLSNVGGIYAFRPISEAGYLRPGIAYLPLSNSASAKALTFTFDNTSTGIGSITTVNAQEKGAYYTLDGVKMSKPAKGLYIHNGKKYYNK